MLTRRSRKEGVASPSKATDKSPKSRRSKTPNRSKSKSIERKIRTRSRSARNKTILSKVKVHDDDSIKKNKKISKSNYKPSLNSLYFNLYIYF